MGAKKSENRRDSAFSEQAGQDIFSGEQEQLGAKKEVEVQGRVQVWVSREKVDIKGKSSVQERCRDSTETEAR